MPQSVSSLSQKEFVAVALMKKEKLKAWIDRMTWLQKAEFLRNLQIACAEYAHGKPALSVTEGEAVDFNNLSHKVQTRAIHIWMYLERALRAEYMAEMMPKIMMRYPEMSKKVGGVEAAAGKKWMTLKKKAGYSQKAKTMAKREFESALRKYRY